MLGVMPAAAPECKSQPAGGQLCSQGCQWSTAAASCLLLADPRRLLLSTMRLALAGQKFALCPAVQLLQQLLAYGCCEEGIAAADRQLRPTCRTSQRQLPACRALPQSSSVLRRRLSMLLPHTMTQSEGLLGVALWKAYWT